MKHKFLWWALPAALLVAALSVWWARPPARAVVPVTESALSQVLVFSGRVASVVRVELGATVTGRVLEVRVRESDRVVAGQVLALLDGEELRAQLNQAQAALASARARLEGQQELALPTSQAALAQATANLEAAEAEHRRNRELFGKGFVAQARIDETERAVQVARAQLEAARVAQKANSSRGNEALQAQLRVREAETAVALAQTRLAQTRILAPAAGRVVLRSVDPGQIVQPGKVLFQFAADGPAQLIGLADEKFLNQLARGQQAKVLVDAFPGKPFEARLFSIAPGIDAARGTVEVKFQVARPPDFLREDMTLSLQVQVGEKDKALVLPAASVIGPGQEGKVRRVIEGRVVEVPVRLGLRTLERVEVLSGLKAGDEVLSAPLQAEPGSRARAQPAP